MPVNKPRIVVRNGKKYDLGTANKSFIKVAQELKTLGIENYLFMLEVIDISVVNIDPYACDKHGHTTLSHDQISRIIDECARNPWYFLREIARIPDPGGVAVPYLANRGNIAQAWCIWKGLDSWLCLPRQKGKTMSALCFQLWMYHFGTSNSSFIFVNKDGDNAKKNLMRLRNLIELLPEYLRFESYVDEDGVKVKATMNATTIRHPVNGNEIVVKSKATSYDKALSLARGLTAPILHFDEPEFTDHIKTIVANSVSTFEQAAKRAKANNAMFGRIFTCTPGDLDTKPGKESQEILDRTVPWTETLYDKSDEYIHNYTHAQGKNSNHILYIEYKYYQIGLTRQWLADLSAEIGDPITVRRELLLQRLHGSSLSPYPQEDIIYINEIGKQPIDELWIMNYYKFDIYKKLDPRIPYLIGVDCASGTDGDNNAISIVNPRTLETDAEFECSYIGETNYENLLIELIRDYLPKGVLCIERNNVGDGIVDHLMKSPIADNLYFDKDRDLVEEGMRQYETIESMLKKEAKKKTYYGVWTGPDSRKDMFAILSRHVHEHKDKFVTKNIIRDLGALVRMGNGKVAAAPGFHDDSIMSYLIALYVYYHGNNLALFGIYKDETDLAPDNSGMRRPEEINPALVDPELIQAAIKQEKLNNQDTWDRMLEKAIKKSQHDTYRLQKAGMISNTVYNNTPSSVVNDYEEPGSIDLDFFNSLNGF